ncbi:MAG TPA: site-2 protease family protein [Actinomycetota bacterium]|nr:site-2 protease family protein [Actinomycetota bacterium]
MTTGVLAFIAAILIVIMVHEAGHFAVAKLFGFKATKFFLGFGPTIWSVQKGETEYGVKALPLGGFVKIIGMSPYEEIEPEDEPRSYPNKPRWQRALLLVAGSATHWVLAFVLLLITTMTIGFPTDQPSNEVAFVQRSVDGVETAAARGGFEVGDRIIAIGGRPTDSWEEIVAYIQERPNETAEFTVEREGREVDIEVPINPAIFEGQELVTAAEPGGDLREPAPGERIGGFLGIRPDARYERLAFLPAIADSAEKVGQLTVASVRGIGDVFGMVFGGELWDALSGTGERQIDEGPLGIVGAGRIAGESVEEGRVIDLVGLIVGFTVFVGLMNLLPLPPLDGGHLAVLAFEKVTGKTVDVRKLIPIAAAVISFFVILFFAVLYLDLARPIKVPF